MYIVYNLREKKVYKVYLLKEKRNNNPYNNNLEGDTFSNIESIRVRFFTVQEGINADLA